MTLNRFDLNLLTALDALLREKNVTRAGERVYLSQSAMSGALQRLREYFTDDLLIRAGREFELTPRAQALAGPIHDILLRIQAALEAEPAFDPATSKRAFSIVMSDYCFVAFMREVLVRVQREAPGVSFQIEPLEASSIRRLEAGDVQLCVLPEMPQLAETVSLITEAGKLRSLRRAKLFADDWVCAVWRDHPTVTDVLSLEQFLALPHAVAHFGAGTVTIEDVGMRREGLTVHNLVSYGGYSVLPLILTGSLMITTIQRRLARLFEPLLPIKLLPPPVQLPALQEAVFWHERHEFEPGHTWMRNLLLEVASQL